MKVRGYLIAGLLYLSFVPVAVSSELAFDNVVNELGRSLKCTHSAVSPSWSAGGGREYGCVSGAQQTAKVFVREQGNTGKVADIQVMWNDWSKGSTVHADKKEALTMLGQVLDKYVPERKEPILSQFKKNSGKKLETDRFFIEYSFTKGPAIDERLVTITPK